MSETKKNPGETDPLSEEELVLVAQLKEFFAGKEEYAEVPDVMYTKFVRGYAHQTPRFEKTRDIMGDMLKWRKKHNIGGLLSDEEKCEKAEHLRINVYPWHVHGVDKEGRPVYYEQTAKCDPETLMRECPPLPVEEAKDNLDGMQTFHLIMMEKMAKLKADLSESTDKLKYKHIVVLDLNGFGFKHASKKFFGQIKSTIDIDQFFYPESLVHLFIINAPFIFKTLWSIVKGWLDPITAQRISVIRGGYLKELEKFIDKDQIPTFYGGSCTIADCAICAEKQFERIDVIQAKK